MRRCSLVLVACLAAQLIGSNAFVPHSPLTSGTVLYGNTKTAPSLPEIKDISYGEESRQYRRTVFTHDDWRKFRSPDRFIYYIKSLFSSGVYKNIGREVGATTTVATLVCLYNAIVGGYTDFDGVQHGALVTSALLPVVGLPLTPFTLSSPSLGLLLGTQMMCVCTCLFNCLKTSCLFSAVFRTNQSYKRWDEARKNWGMNINHTRDLVRMGTAMYDRKSVSTERAENDLKTLALCTWAFVRSMKRHLSPEDEDEDDFQNELYEKLPHGQAAAIIGAAHRPNRALQDLSVAIENLPMHFMRKNEIHKAATIFEDNLGSSERLLTSPVPLFFLLTPHSSLLISLVASSPFRCLPAVQRFLEPHCHDSRNCRHICLFVWN